MRTLRALAFFFLAVARALPAEGLLMNAGDSLVTQIPLTHRGTESGFGTRAMFLIGAGDFEGSDVVRFQMRLAPDQGFLIDQNLDPNHLSVSVADPLSPWGFWGQNEVRVTVSQGSILLYHVSYQEQWDVGMGFVTYQYGEALAVPEPSSVGLFLLGLGSLGVVLSKGRRRIRSRTRGYALARRSARNAC